MYQMCLLRTTFFSNEEIKTQKCVDFGIKNACDYRNVKIKIKYNTYNLYITRLMSL